MMSKKYIISAFNMYKSGSLSYFERMSDSFCHVNGSCVILTKEMQASLKFSDFVTILYPIKFLNQVYRVFIEQLVVPILALLKRANSLVMLGNFPSLLWNGNQRVLFHNTLYLTKEEGSKRIFYLESLFFRFLIRVKKPIILVQTQHIKNMLESFFNFPLNISVVGVPQRSVPCNMMPVRVNGKIKLFYPANFHPHKNHSIIKSVNNGNGFDEIEMVFTLSKSDIYSVFGGCEEFRGITSIGSVDRQTVDFYYRNCSALLFLSKTESLGMPLIEACEFGLPIIAPNLPYVNAVISNYYEFEIDNPKSLDDAIVSFIYDYKSGACKIARAKVLFSQEQFARLVFGL